MTHARTANEWEGWHAYGGALFWTGKEVVALVRRGQRCRFRSRDRKRGFYQVGPEQANVAPALAYASSQGWLALR